MTPLEFFESPQGAAILKHGILRRYLHGFVSKTGKYATGGRVVYVDGYAGRGEYLDGSPGSPMIAADVAGLVADLRQLDCFFVEKDPGLFADLDQLCARELPSAHRRQGEIEDHLAEAVAFAGDSPMLVLLDPFGLTIPFQQFEGLLCGRSAPTEVIINVSLSALRRWAGHITSPKGVPGIIAKMDLALGGDWWHQVWRDLRGCEPIAHAYIERCRNAFGGGYYSADVSDRWKGTTAYCLLLLTRHQDGLWLFNEALSLANEDLRAADPTALADADLLLPFAAEWEAEIKANIRGLLNAKGQFVLEHELGNVLGTTLGYARGTHIRKVIKQLHKEGVTSTTGVGDLQPMRIVAT